jgi:hypothetical protein
MAPLNEPASQDILKGRDFDFKFLTVLKFSLLFAPLFFKIFWAKTKSIYLKCSKILYILHFFITFLGELTATFSFSKCAFLATFRIFSAKLEILFAPFCQTQP